MSHLIKMKLIGSVNYLYINSFTLKLEWMGKIRGSDYYKMINTIICWLSSKRLFNTKKMRWECEKS